MKLLIRWAITALALFVAAKIVPGIYVDGGGWVVYALMAVILGLANAFIRPLLTLLTCPFILLTLGLFTIIINALTLLAASWLATDIFNVGFHIDGFWPALLGSIVVSIVSVALNMLVHDDKKEKHD